MSSPYSKKWDKKDKGRSDRPNEPSNRFYDIVISSTVGIFIGLVIGAWILLG